MPVISREELYFDRTQSDDFHAMIVKRNCSETPKSQVLEEPESMRQRCQCHGNHPVLWWILVHPFFQDPQHLTQGRIWWCSVHTFQYLLSHWKAVYLYSFSPSENGPRSTFCLQVTRGQGWVVLRKETVHLVTSCAVHSNSAEEEEVRCKSYVEIIQVSKKATARHLWTHEGHENYTFPELWHSKVMCFPLPLGRDMWLEASQLCMNGCRKRSILCKNKRTDKQLVLGSQALHSE